MGSKAKALLLVVFLGLLLARLVPMLLQPVRPGAADPVLLLGQAGQRDVSLQLRLLDDPRSSADGQRCRALGEVIRPATVQGRVELSLAPCPPLQAGWLVKATGVLSRPQPAPHPLLAGLAERLARQGVWSQLRVSQLQVLARPQTPVADLRRRIAERLRQQAGPANGGVLSALVLGSAVVPLPDAVRQSFRAAGLSHALAASGFHLSVLLGAVLVLGRRLSPSLRLALAAAAMLLFLLLAGPQPSVLRAVGMGAIALGLLEGGQRSQPLWVLLMTAGALLLWRPDWLLDVGFQLSVAATAGLILTARPLEDALAGHGPRWLAAAAAVPLAAMVWTLPLQLLHFGVVPLYAVPANLLAAPLLTPLTLAAMALALLAVLLPASLPLLLPPVAALAALLVQITQWIAALPMAQWQLGRPEPLLVLLLAVASAALALPRVPGRWRWAAGGVLVLVAALHFGALRADQLLLVHQSRGLQSTDLLVARHQGRAALISSRSDRWSCLQAARLAQGLGVQRFDWALLLDPHHPDDPACWQQQAGLVQASADGSPPLLPGQRLTSPGLEAAPLAIDAQTIALRFGAQRWLLLPDQQSLWAWQEADATAINTAGSWQGLWLGFRPTAAQRRILAGLDGAVQQRWFSGSGGRRPPRGWWASGSSGSLAWGGRSTLRLAGASSGPIDP